MCRFPERQQMFPAQLLGVNLLLDAQTRVKEIATFGVFGGRFDFDGALARDNDVFGLDGRTRGVSGATLVFLRWAFPAGGT